MEGSDVPDDDLPFDPADPPYDPPAGSNSALWRLAYLVHGQHRRRADGRCGLCAVSWPCDAKRLADGQLRTACRIQPTGSGDAEPPDEVSCPL